MEKREEEERKEREERVVRDRGREGQVVAVVDAGDPAPDRQRRQPDFDSPARQRPRQPRGRRVACALTRLIISRGVRSASRRAALRAPARSVSRRSAPSSPAREPSAEAAACAR